MGFCVHDKNGYKRRKTVKRMPVNLLVSPLSLTLIHWKASNGVGTRPFTVTLHFILLYLVSVASVCLQGFTWDVMAGDKWP